MRSILLLLVAGCGSRPKFTWEQCSAFCMQNWKSCDYSYSGGCLRDYKIDDGMQKRCDLCDCVELFGEVE